MVLHGGGNTSVKVRAPDVFGKPEDLLYVKGSGWDLATIEVAGFSPCRMDRLLKLAELPRLSDLEMARELRVSLTEPSAPAPSVEAILHAMIPHKYVDHTHADAFIALSNTPRGLDYVRECYGDGVVIIPYVMPGFVLAKRCFEMMRSNSLQRVVGIALMNHGLVTFGETAKESYDRMIDLVTKAEDYIARHRVGQPLTANPQPSAAISRKAIASLRQEVSKAIGKPAILNKSVSDPDLQFARRGDIATISQQGPATPDHVIRTKRVPLIGRDVPAYCAAYREYFERNKARGVGRLTMLDCAPRVILDPELGLCTVGLTAGATMVARDIYRHTIRIIEQACAIGGWKALSEADVFDVEYWDLEQAKLRASSGSKEFSGEVALVTGAASGIGKACVQSLLDRGAAVVGLDIDPAITTLHARPDFLGLTCDLTQADAVKIALDQAAVAFGGLDILVLNAGIFPKSIGIKDLTLESWRRVMTINVDANLVLLRECYEMLALAPAGGRVAIVGSKNVRAPGPGAAAYSASKAALNQLARVAALEWADAGIRVNSVHPNMVFDTKLWTDEVMKARALSYGLTVEQYRRNNLLHVSVTSADVGELVAAICGRAFAKTTGAHVPVDGGNERVI